MGAEAGLARRPSRTEPVIATALRTADSAPAAPRPRQPSRRTVALVPWAVALAVGLWGIRREGTLWGDEAATYEIAHRSLSGIWRTLGHVDAVHGLYYLFMHAVFTLHDGGPATLRLPSVLAVSATAAGVALLGHRLVGPRAGLLAGLVLPLIPAVQRYAQEGRSYALVCALVTWGTWLLISRRWAAYTAVMLAAGLLHEFAALAVLAHGITVFRWDRAGRLPGGGPGTSPGLRRSWLVAAACVAAGLAPLAVFSMTQSSQVEWIGLPRPGQLIAFAAVAATGLACARIGTRETRTGETCAHRARTHETRTHEARTPPDLRTVALPLLLAPAGLLMAVSYLHPLYVGRYVLFQAVGLALLLGSALDRLWSRAVALVAAAAALVALFPVGLPLRTPQSRQNDVTAVSAAVAATARPGDGLLFAPARRRAWTFWHPGDYRALDDLALKRSPRASHSLYGTEQAPGEIRRRMLAHPRIVVISDLPGQPLDTTAQEEIKRRTLHGYFTACGSRRVTSALITVYARAGGCPVARP
ncbi:hypothetical protein [Streptomyces sp. NBC_01014]|uniref:glycosyltransferase family 39 protein n=1 Tax=Streptomyces sp. NBC_01014 TaxID=2903719 RepID=UPI00386AE049|nr:hypothetical protein OG282_17420 [Streptomyces sp. NBC_01014]